MRRAIAAVAAVILAVIGAVLLSRYVQNADERALAGLEAAEVLVVGEVIPEGTTAEDAATLVSLQTLPVSAVVPGALTDLEDVAGQVTTTVLQPGEQVLASRFVDPASLAEPTRVDVPVGMQELAVLLDPQRVIGGQLKPGDVVGVFVSLDSPPADDYKTKLVLNQVLVTRIEGSITADPGQTQPLGGAEEQGATVPTSPIMVIVALGSPDAERLVFGMEHGTVWLSLQNGETDLGGSRVVTPGNVLE